MGVKGREKEYKEYEAVFAAVVGQGEFPKAIR